MAVESGGNVEGSLPDREVEVNGVRILGPVNLPGRVAAHASQMYAGNVAHLIAHFWDKEAATLRLDPEDEILKGCLVTHGGEIRHELLRRHYSGQGA
jgi:NAD(P) transhydrogenase subunit alpha